VRAAGISRRGVVMGLAAAAALPARPLRAGQPLSFGLTPVFLSNDLLLLEQLKTYLAAATGREVRLTSRRTYQEITALLVSGQLDAAWICGYPFVQFRDRLALVAVPVWRGAPLYRSHLIAGAGRGADDIEALAGDLHAFSDPDSNSGYLVTRALIAERGLDPGRFFRRGIFTYGHRNVIRAVAAGLAQSGSVDGYVHDVLTEVEPDLTAGAEIVRRSEPLGFPPVACLAAQASDPRIGALRAALLGMGESEAGRGVLKALRLDGFIEAPGSLFDGIAAKMRLVQASG